MGKGICMLIAAWAVALTWVIPNPENLCLQLFGLAVLFVAFWINSDDPRRA